jgi:RNA polymerase sigma-70 factor (ECF subfamily)
MQETFVELIARHHRSLYAYIFAFLPSAADADDVFQQTCVTIWREFERFEPDSDFQKWSQAIAFNQIRNFRRKMRRDRHVFCDDVVEQMAEQRAEAPADGDARRRWLESCIELLRPRDRELLAVSYSGATTFKQAAEKLGRPANTVYKALNRIRRLLLECVERRAATEP